MSIEIVPTTGEIQFGFKWHCSQPIDVDVSAVCFLETGNLQDAAFYNQLSACNGSVVHGGDLRGGNASGYAETVKVQTQNLGQVTVVALMLSAYSGGNLGACESIQCDLIDGTSVRTSISLDSAEIGAKSSCIMGLFYLSFETYKWTFKKVIYPTAGRHFGECIRPLRALVDTVINPRAKGDFMLCLDKTFQMTKGQEVMLGHLTNHIKVGLGWTSHSKRKKLDLDASCVLLMGEKDCEEYDQKSIVYFGARKMPGIELSPDNTTGQGDGDDESFNVYLDKVDADVDALAFTCNIFTSGGKFSDVSDAFIRLFDPATDREMARYELHDDLSDNGVIFCTLVRDVRGESKSTWSLISIGQEVHGVRANVIDKACFSGKKWREMIVSDPEPVAMLAEEMDALTMTRPVVIIKAVGAANLKNTETLTKQDPYLLLSVSGDGQVHRSRVHEDGGRNATWGDSFAFLPADINSEIVTVTVMNENSIKDTVVGRVQMKLSELLEGNLTNRETFEKTVTITDPTNVTKSAGEVKLVLRCFEGTSMVPHGADADVTLNTEIIIKAVGATDLRNTETLTKQDPYLLLSVSCDDHVHRSRIHEDGGRNATWGDSFVFPMDTSENGVNKLTLACMNKNNLKKDVLIGRVEVDLNNIFNSHDGVVEELYTEVVGLVDPDNVSKVAGKVSLELTWHQYRPIGQQSVFNFKVC